MFDLAARQRDAGDEVDFFGMGHDENEPMPYERWFPSRIDLEPPPDGLGAKARRRRHASCGRAAPATGMAAVLDAVRPDVVHLHNIYHQLSPSILRPVAAAGVPAVMTLHDYKLACPTYRFLDHGEICERCLPHRFWEPILRRCNGGSLAASAVSAVELTRAHADRARYGPVRRFVCPSRFLLGEDAAGQGLPRPAAPPAELRGRRARSRRRQAPGGGVVYAGRLSAEKGVDTLVDAVLGEPGARARRGRRRPRASGPGDARRPGGRPHPVPRAPARRRGPAELLRGAAVAAVPSRWYENMPLAVLEAFGAGVPVVGERARRAPRADRAGRGRRDRPARRPRPRSPRRCARSSSDPDRRVRDGSRGAAEGGVCVRRRGAPGAAPRRSTPRRAPSVRPLRIGVIGARGVPATFGGIEHHVEELGARMVARGHEVTVFARPNYLDHPIDRAPRDPRGGAADRGHQAPRRDRPQRRSRRAARWPPRSTCIQYHAIGPGIPAALPGARWAARRSS